MIFSLSNVGKCVYCSNRTTVYIASDSVGPMYMVRLMLMTYHTQLVWKYHVQCLRVYVNVTDITR